MGELNGNQHNEQADNTTHHTHSPTLTGDITDSLRGRDIYQQRIIKDLGCAVTDLCQDEEKNAKKDIPCLNEKEQPGKKNG
ncbi:hypothetical protein SDC9_157610 [bioreactor metagenome]|uniref:Uncharacterized protein n=1 Tax=bioreactor metagenome TaxID=1076179 RepID=A0A645F7G7_9ZZZZ